MFFENRNKMNLPTGRLAFFKVFLQCWIELGNRKGLGIEYVAVTYEVRKFTGIY